LTSSPYSLTTGDQVIVKVIATNVKGDSVISDSGTGATVITKPDAPINLSETLSERTVTTIGIQWNIGAQNGGASVEEYRINIAE
jgi:hypothetical protein